MRARFLTLLFPLLLLLLPSGCSTQGSPGSARPGASGTPGFADVLLTDAAVDDLFAFQVVVVEVRPITAAGEFGDDLLDQPFPLEVLGLRGTHAWLSGAELPAGTYTGLRVAFRPFAYAARATNGRDVRVDAASDVLVARFPAPVQVAAGGYVRLVVDLDLGRSLSGDPLAGVVRFDPLGSAVERAGGVLAFDDLVAKVVSRDPGSRSLEVEGFAGGDGGSSIGSLPVILDAGSLLVDPTGFVQDRIPYFLTFLTPGATFVELHGTLGPDGSIRATRVEVEAQNGVPGAFFPVKLEGVVEALTPAGFSLRLRAVERGPVFALPVLAGLGDPAVLQVAIDARTLLFTDGGRLAGSPDLLPGRRVDAKFATFGAPPFPALRIAVGGTDPGAGAGR